VSGSDDVIILGPLDEARRLWKGAVEARKSADEDVVALCNFLDLGLHAAEILVIHLLQPVKANFPATIGLGLDTPDPEVDVHRDAISEPKALQFTDLLDLLSDEELECVGPRMHRGWEDRRFSCRRSRATSREALGVNLGDAERNDLLLLAAYRNRIFRYPPPVRVERARVLRAFGALSNLIESLFQVTERNDT